MTNVFGSSIEYYSPLLFSPPLAHTNVSSSLPLSPCPPVPFLCPMCTDWNKTLIRCSLSHFSISRKKKIIETLLGLLPVVLEPPAGSRREKLIREDLG